MRRSFPDASPLHRRKRFRFSCEPVGSNFSSFLDGNTLALWTRLATELETMSVRALFWALEQEVFPSSKKFVLVALANFASDTGKSFPSTESIGRITCQQINTVRNALDGLVQEGVISDTGKRTGATGQIKVYQLPEDACEPTKDLRKRRSFNGQRLLKDSDKSAQRLPKECAKTYENVGHNKELEHRNKEHGTKERDMFGFLKPTLDAVKLESAKAGLPEIEAENFFHFYESKGWKVGKVAMKNWHAALAGWRNRWKERHSENHRIAEPKQIQEVIHVRSL